MERTGSFAPRALIHPSIQSSLRETLKVAKHSFARAFADAIQRAHKDCKKQTCCQ